MGIKKSKNADLENARLPRVFLGLGIAVTLTLAASEYMTFDEVKKYNKKSKDKLEDEIIDIPEILETPPPPPPQMAPPPQIEDIVEVEDDQVVEEVEILVQNKDDEIVTFTPPPPKDEPPAKVEIFDVVSNSPTFPGGEEALYKFLADNLKYPAIAREAGTQGKVYVQFVVWTDGSIRDVQVLRGIGSGCDEEAIRVVKMMPNWQPGEQMGKKVPVRYRLPIKFTLA